MHEPNWHHATGLRSSSPITARSLTTAGPLGIAAAPGTGGGCCRGGGGGGADGAAAGIHPGRDSGYPGAGPGC
jgi:hypothetical protein